MNAPSHIDMAKRPQKPGCGALVNRLDELNRKPDHPRRRPWRPSPGASPAPPNDPSTRATMVSIPSPVRTVVNEKFTPIAPLTDERADTRLPQLTQLSKIMWLCLKFSTVRKASS